MPTFAYVALDQKGREHTGRVEATNARDAATALRNQSIYVVSIKEGDTYDTHISGLANWRDFRETLSPRQYLPVRAQDLVFLFHQIALMLRSGHTVVQALEANQQMTSKRALRKALRHMGEDIQRGGSFSRAVAAQKSLFPPQVNKLLEAGEQSGEIDTILERLADDLERRVDVKRQLATALTYPGIVFTMAIGVSAALIGWVIPRFAHFLTSRDVTLPPITQFLLDVADWFQTWGGITGAIALTTVFGVLAASTTKRGKKVIDRAVLHLPVVGKVIIASGLAQATWTLAMQLRSGISLLPGLRITSDVTSNRVLADAFGRASDDILAGQALSTALQKSAIPPLVVHMAAIGERSGELDGVMTALGEFYRKDLQARVKMLAAWVEPALIIIVGGMVAVVYLAFFQAALQVSSGGM